ncbi:MAG: BamA/TamA family outer membrane protein [Sphingorhabdus sp.]
MVRSSVFVAVFLFAVFPIMIPASVFAQATPSTTQPPVTQPPVTPPPAPPPPDPRAPIITDEEFEEAVPSLDDAPLESVEEWQREQDAKEVKNAGEVGGQNVGEPPLPALQDRDVVETLADPPVTDPLLDDPLPPIDSFDAEPPPEPTQAGDEDSSTRVRYRLRLVGLDDPASGTDNPDAASYGNIRDRFYDLSALGEGDRRADNRATIAARARLDQKLLLDIMNGEGFYDATVNVSAEVAASPDEPSAVVLTVSPGRRYYLGVIAFAAPAVEPADLITGNFVPKTGDPIVADVILASEANIAVVLPQNGYPFATVGQRDILLDGETGVGDYTLPVDTGARSYFGALRTEGTTAFDATHIGILRRFKQGDLYDSRKVDDLRAALVATGLLSTVSVEPVKSSAVAPDGTPYADLLVRQEAGPARTLAASAGYGTGQGFRVEGSWTHRNLFPPEGSLSVTGVLGTQEQSAGVAFSRANAGRRDRNVDLALSALHSNYDAFEAYTAKLAGAISYISTPIWQKKFTYSYGFELLATSEDEYNFVSGLRERQLYSVAALPGQVGFDTSDNLLNPTKGFRLNLRLSPEASLGSGKHFYGRFMLDGSAYYSVNESIVVAGRARVGSIAGIDRGDLAPSRRYYGGGGGSVRGYGYQKLGPRDPNNDPIGGRSVNEAAVELRYRFGNFGVVGFVDAGQVYESSMPKFDDWRFGVGIGGRFYTNFGPIRLDLATPLNREKGDSRITVYVSIGQAF